MVKDDNGKILDEKEIESTINQNLAGALGLHFAMVGQIRSVGAESSPIDNAEILMDIRRFSEGLSMRAKTEEMSTSDIHREVNYYIKENYQVNKNAEHGNVLISLRDRITEVENENKGEHRREEKYSVILVQEDKSYGETIMNVIDGVNVEERDKATGLYGIKHIPNLAISYNFLDKGLGGCDEFKVCRMKGEKSGRFNKKQFEDFMEQAGAVNLTKDVSKDSLISSESGKIVNKVREGKFLVYNTWSASSGEKEVSCPVQSVGITPRNGINSDVMKTIAQRLNNESTSEGAGPEQK